MAWSPGGRFFRSRFSVTPLPLDSSNVAVPTLSPFAFFSSTVFLSAACNNDAPNSKQRGRTVLIFISKIIDGASERSGSSLPFRIPQVRGNQFWKGVRPLKKIQPLPYRHPLHIFHVSRSSTTLFCSSAAIDPASSVA